MNEMTSPVADRPDPQAPTRPSLFEAWRSRVEYQALSLGLVCALVALSLLWGNRLTHDRIGEALLQDRMAILHQVLPESLYDNNPLEDALQVEDAELGRVEVYPAILGGELKAIAFQVSPIGYGGPIDAFIAVDTAGEILGVRILSHKETPGLADKIEIGRSDWITGFDGLSLANTPHDDWAVKKDGGRFDQFAGATITPRAVVKGIVQALQFHARHAAGLIHSQQEVQP